MSPGYIQLTKQLLDRMGRTEDEHSEVVFNRGVAFINRLEPHVPYQKMFLESELFWDWWKFEWYKRNNILLMQLLREENNGMYQNRMAVEARFFAIHNVQRDQLYPSRVLVNLIKKEYQHA